MRLFAITIQLYLAGGIEDNKAQLFIIIIRVFVQAFNSSSARLKVIYS